MLNAMEYVYYAYAFVAIICGGSLLFGLYHVRQKKHDAMSAPTKAHVMVHPVQSPHHPTHKATHDVTTFT